MLIDRQLQLLMANPCLAKKPSRDKILWYSLVVFFLFLNICFLKDCIYWCIFTGWWFGTFFFHILEIKIPTDFHIFHRGRYTTVHISMVIFVFSPRHRGWWTSVNSEVNRLQIQGARLDDRWCIPGICLVLFSIPLTIVISTINHSYWSFIYVYIYIYESGSIITTEPCSPEPWNHGLF